MRCGFSWRLKKIINNSMIIAVKNKEDILMAFNLNDLRETLTTLATLPIAPTEPSQISLVAGAKNVLGHRVLSLQSAEVCLPDLSIPPTLPTLSEEERREYLAILSANSVGLAQITEVIKRFLEVKPVADLLRNPAFKIPCVRACATVPMIENALSNPGRKTMPLEIFGLLIQPFLQLANSDSVRAKEAVQALAVMVSIDAEHEPLPTITEEAAQSLAELFLRFVVSEQACKTKLQPIVALTHLAKIHQSSVLDALIGFNLAREEGAVSNMYQPLIDLVREENPNIQVAGLKVLECLAKEDMPEERDGNRYVCNGVVENSDICNLLLNRMERANRDDVREGASRVLAYLASQLTYRSLVAISLVAPLFALLKEPHLDANLEVNMVRALTNLAKWSSEASHEMLKGRRLKILQDLRKRDGVIGTYAADAIVHIQQQNILSYTGVWVCLGLFGRASASTEAGPDPRAPGR